MAVIVVTMTSAMHLRNGGRIHANPGGPTIVIEMNLSARRDG
jgi:hypothetical protein